jgi:hypothetical protein
MSQGRRPKVAIAANEQSVLVACRSPAETFDDFSPSI